MESQKPNSVKTIGLFIALFSGLTIFGNIMGGLVITLIVFGDDQNSPAEISDFNFIEYLLHNYVYMCIAR